MQCTPPTFRLLLQRGEMEATLAKREPGVVHIFADARAGRGVKEVRNEAIDALKRFSPRLFSPARAPGSVARSAAADEVAMRAAAATGLPNAGLTMPLLMMVAGAPNTGEACQSGLPDQLPGLPLLLD